jgi:four helix bundle protein
VKDFKKLPVWIQARKLALEVFAATAQFPKQQQYVLTSQIQRAAVSIMANIAEGCGRRTDAELAQLLQYAFGSACELESHLDLAFELGLLKDAGILESLIEIKKMLGGFLRWLRAP